MILNRVVKLKSNVRPGDDDLFVMIGIEHRILLSPEYNAFEGGEGGGGRPRTQIWAKEQNSV